MKTKVISVVLTAFILVILILSGPANAFDLGFNISDISLTKGEKTTFDISLNLAETEILNVSSITLFLDGFKKNDYACKFNSDGTALSGCNGITIKKVVHNVTDAPDGYGYGYGYQSRTDKVSYLLTLDSAKFPSGKYKTEIEVKSGKNIVKTKGENLLITFVTKGLDGCSIRAKDGNLTVDNKLFTDSKLNFFVQKKNAARATGYIYAQLGRTRVSYDFTTEEVLENDNNHAIILVTGSYVMNVGPKIPETAMIYFDKITNKITISGEKVNAQNLDVTFDQKC